MGLPQMFPNIVLFQHPLSEGVFVGFVSDSQKLFFMFCKKISIGYNTSGIYTYRLIEHISLASPCPFAFHYPIKTIGMSRSSTLAVFFMLLQQLFNQAMLLHASN